MNINTTPATTRPAAVRLQAGAFHEVLGPFWHLDDAESVDAQAGPDPHVGIHELVLFSVSGRFIISAVNNSGHSRVTENQVWAQGVQGIRVPLRIGDLRYLSRHICEARPEWFEFATTTAGIHIRWHGRHLQWRIPPTSDRSGEWTAHEATRAPWPLGLADFLVSEDEVWGIP